MYYPHQIPYRLDQNFHQFVNYQETKLDELSAVCMCIWEMKSKQIIDRVITNQILPDACIDIVFDFVNQSICFAGYSKETEAFPLYQAIDYMGVRLRPVPFMLYMKSMPIELWIIWFPLRKLKQSIILIISFLVIQKRSALPASRSI